MSKIKTLDRLATDAEILKMTKQCIKNGSAKLYDLFPKLIVIIVKEELWYGQLNQYQKPFNNFLEFALHPLWQGLAIESTDRLLDYCKYSKEALKVIYDEIQPLLSHGGTGANRYTNKINYRGRDTTSVKKPLRGNTYLIARLKRDHPDIISKLMSGGYKNVHQAAIAAGIIKVKTPLEKIQVELKKLTMDEYENAKQSIEKMKHIHIKQKKYTRIERNL